MEHVRRQDRPEFSTVITSTCFRIIWTACTIIKTGKYRTWAPFWFNYNFIFVWWKSITEVIKPSFQKCPVLVMIYWVYLQFVLNFSSISYRRYLHLLNIWSWDAPYTRGISNFHSFEAPFLKKFSVKNFLQELYFWTSRVYWNHSLRKQKHNIKFRALATILFTETELI